MTKHPLVQKEWKTSRWVMLIFTLIYGTYAVLFNNSITYNKERYLFSDGSSSNFMYELYAISMTMLPLTLIGIAILVILLFSHERNLKVGKFIGSLPFNKKSQFKIKYMMGMVTFTLPFLLFAITMIFIRIQNNDWLTRLYEYAPAGGMLVKQESLGALLIWLGVIWLIMMAVYSFLMLVQTLMGQNIIAGIIGAIIYMVPWFLIYAVPANIYLINGRWFLNNVWDSVQFFFQGTPKTNIEPVIDLGKQTLFREWNHVRAYGYHNLGLNLGILIVVIIISTILAYRFILDNDVEKNGDIVMYPWFGKILIAGISLCSALLLPLIVAIFTSVENSILTIALMITGGIIGYVISKRSIEITQKHG